MNKLAKLFAVLALLTAATRASADQYSVMFSSSAFAAGGGASSIPQEVVTGSLTFSSASLDAPVLSLEFVSLSIAGHTYSLDEVIASTFYYSNGATAGHRFDGALNGQAYVPGTNDFSLSFYDLGSLGPAVATYFVYSVAGVSGDFFSSTGTASVTAVPEAATAALLLTGLLALSVRRSTQLRQSRQ